MAYKQIDTSTYQSIMNEYHTNSLVAKVVSSFGYDKQQMSSFFNPLNEFNFKDEVLQPIKTALLKIKEEKTKVFVFGDYDCDGLGATTIMVSLLNKLEIENGYYIPNRLSEGYGLNLNRLQQAYGKGYRAIITVDNGVKAHEALKWARENNMTSIVIDHHEIQEQVECDYLLHPSLLDDDYHYLCGCCLTYMLCKYMHLEDDNDIVLAGLTTISDAMSLNSVNSKIVNDALKVLNNKTYNNILSLDTFSYPINEDDLSFKVIPKLNAIGRLADKANVNNAVRFLLSKNINEVQYYGKQIIDINKQRIELTNQAYSQIESLIKNDDIYNFIYYPTLHEGLIGLLATRIASATGKITFVLTDNEDTIRCSCRSNGSYDIMSTLVKYSDKFVAFGGHSQACGFSINKINLDDFKYFLDREITDVNETYEEYILLDDTDLTINNIEELYRYRPFGKDKQLPLIKFTLNHIQSYRQLKNEFQLKWLNNGIEFVSFHNKGYQQYLDTNVTIIGNLSINKFNNRLTYQIMVQEIL